MSERGGGQPMSKATSQLHLWRGIQSKKTLERNTSMSRCIFPSHVADAS